MTKILVTGAPVLGSHVHRIVTSEKMAQDFVFVGSERGDLTNFATTMALLDDVQPDIVIHLLPCGRHGDNRARPADYFITPCLSRTCSRPARKGVKRIIYTMGGCSHLGTAGSPISEDEMWNGYPQGDSAAYSSAKKMGIVAAQAYPVSTASVRCLYPGQPLWRVRQLPSREVACHPPCPQVHRGDRGKTGHGDDVGNRQPHRDFVYAEDVAHPAGGYCAR